MHLVLCCRPAPSTLAALAWALAVSGCGDPSEPDPLFDVAPIQVESVEVMVLESFPAQANAHVTGVIGDGCAELLPIEQSRGDNEVRISILRQRPLDAVCIQIAKLFDDTIRLQGTFAPGDYTLHVNDVSVSFRVD